MACGDSKHRWCGGASGPFTASGGGFGVVGGDALRSPEAPLGNLTKSSVKKTPNALRLLDLAHQRTAARLMPQERVKSCRWAMISAAHGVDVAMNAYRGADGSETLRAAFKGLRVCGSVWVCPVCARRISETRRRELNKLLEFGRAQGLVPVMLTLTTRHQHGDDLRAQLVGMKTAKDKLRQRQAWRKIKPQIVGTVTATEVTFGANGPHVHFHEIALLKGVSGDAEALALFDEMPKLWRDCLRSVGLDADLTHGFTARGADRAGAYVAKWGAAEELALSGAKRARKGGRTPRELLAAAHEGDKRAAAIWADFVRAFKGRRQLVWSQGLKALAGVDEQEDQEAAADETQDGQTQQVIANISAEDWRGGARNRRGEILDAAEAGGAEGVALAVAEALGAAPGAKWGAEALSASDGSPEVAERATEAAGVRGRARAEQMQAPAPENEPAEGYARTKAKIKRRRKPKPPSGQMTLLEWGLFGGRDGPSACPLAPVLSLGAVQAVGPEP